VKVEYLLDGGVENTPTPHGLAGPRRYSVNDATANRSCAQKSDELRRAFERVMLDVEGEFEGREARALAVANEMVRGWLERELQRIADESADEVLVEDVRYRRHSSGERRYHTLCGAVTVRRDSYRMVGVRNGPTVVRWSWLRESSNWRRLRSHSA
jgi:hypothetical protein